MCYVLLSWIWKAENERFAAENKREMEFEINNNQFCVDLGIELEWKLIIYLPILSHRIYIHHTFLLTPIKKLFVA